MKSIFFTLLILILSHNVNATLILDQNNSTIGGGFCHTGTGNNCGQSFMQDNDNLAGVGIHVNSGWSAGDGTITMSIYDSYGPTLGNLLATGTSGTINSNSGWVDVFWSAISVDTASTYYMVIDSSQDYLVASYSSYGDDYVNGNALYAGSTSSYSNYDLSFRTYYDDASTIPEPTSLILLGIAVVGMGLSRKRKEA